MAWEFSVLVVANVTASSDELLAALRERAEQGGCRFTLVMPASGAEARERLDAALEGMRAAELENVSGQVGDPDPVVAVMEAWDPMKFDEILVSTLPTGSSRWVEANLPRRLEKLTSAPVRHVISTPKTEPHESAPSTRHTACCRRSPRRLRDAEVGREPAEARHPLAVLGRRAKHERVGLRPLEEEVQVVLPGEADAAVDLERGGAHAPAGIRGVRLRHRGGLRERVRLGVRAPGRGTPPSASPRPSRSIWAQRCETAW